MSISISDFDAFHRAIHGDNRGPFDWQQRLLVRIIEERRWPRVLDIPTGAGKTTCLDIALFALAVDAQNPARLWCPRRIVMVVDRRVVVDQVAERGRRLASALAAPKSEVVQKVADALRSLRGDPDRKLDPLGVFTLRGGMPKDDGWTRTPDQPLIIASTVDQVGSRLLVQGYGVSTGMLPVHAGLIGNDTLILLDEVHLSEPFRQTLNALSELRERFAPNTELPKRFEVAFLSATPGNSGGAHFALQEEDRTRESPLGPRLYARKPVSLEEADDRPDLEKKCEAIARRLIDNHGVVGVVLNRVASASRVADWLTTSAKGEFDVRLLTGRMRPLDRDDVIRELRPRIMADRRRGDKERKLVVVGTQCIEAGADFDFDALVTEGASLDALRQRFGRVDRLGQYTKAEGVIVFDKSSKSDDPVYGASLQATMKWLKSKANKKSKRVDFGIAHLEIPDSGELAALLAPKKNAPILLPAYMDLWMQTSPAPAVVPDVSLWLHGPQSAPADIQIVWRVDLTEEHLRSDDARTAIGIVGAIRPSALESISLPFASARAWLHGSPVGEIFDVEGTAQGEIDHGHLPRKALKALRWNGSDSDIITAETLRPGYTIVVPAIRGGIRNACFDPVADGTVEDLAERSALMGRGQPVLRLHPDVLKGLRLPISLEDEEEAIETLSAVVENESNGWRKVWLQALVNNRRARPIVVDGDRDSRWLVLQRVKLHANMLRKGLDADDSHEDGVELTTDEDDSYHAGRHVPLSKHSTDVERFARAYADAVGLPRRLSEDIALAAWLHDIGKADKRFQLMLRGGSEIDLFKEPQLWAKSAMAPGDKGAQRRARERSGYPNGTRHEVQSLFMLERHREKVQATANDPDLVQFLVASHHGYCRPFAPVATDEKPVDVTLDEHSSAAFGTWSFGPVTSANQLHRLDSSLADRFWSLVEKYGWLELCWLEAILRLADHRASEWEQTEGGAP